MQRELAFASPAVCIRHTPEQPRQPVFPPHCQSIPLFPYTPMPLAADASRADARTYPRPQTHPAYSPHSASHAAPTQGRAEWPVERGAFPGGEMKCGSRA